MDPAALNRLGQMYSVWYQILLEKLLRLTAPRGDPAPNPGHTQLQACARELPAQLSLHHIQSWNKQQLDEVFQQLMSLAKEVLFRRYDESVRRHDASVEYNRRVNSLVRDKLQLCDVSTHLTLR